MKNYFSELKNREFVGIIKKAYGGDKFGWYEVEIPELLPGQTITVYDASQKNLIDGNSGAFYPLLVNQKVIIKFKSNNINSGYIDRIYEGNIFELGKSGAISHSKYIVVTTPNNHTITIDNKSNTLNIFLSGGKCGITLDNNGIKLCTLGKVEISAGDIVDIKSSSNIFLHEGAPSCSSSSIQNQNLKSVISNIDYFPSTNLSISPSVLISALDKVIQENTTPSSNKTSTDTQKNIDEYFNKLVAKIDIARNNLARLFEESSTTLENLDNELNTKLNELKTSIEQLDNLIAELNNEAIETPESVKNFSLFSKYFYCTVTNDNYFNLTEEAINMLDEKYGKLLTPYLYNSQTQLAALGNAVQTKITDEYIPLLNDFKTKIVIKKEYLSDILGKKFVTSFKNWNSNIDESLKNITDYYNKLTKISEDSLLSCDSKEKLEQYCNDIVSLTDKANRELGRMVNTYRAAANMSNVLNTKNENSVLSAYISTFSNSNTEFLNSVSQNLENIKNSLSQPFSDLNDYKDKIRKSLYEIKKNLSDVISRADRLKFDKTVISNTLKFEYQNVICDILSSLSNLELGLDLNFGLDLHIPEFLLNLIPDFNVSLANSAATVGANYSSCIDVNPCTRGSLSFDLGLLIPIDDLIQLLLTAALLPLYKLLMDIAELIKSIKELLSKKLLLNFGVSIHLPITIFQDLLNYINREFKKCIGTNMKASVENLISQI